MRTLIRFLLILLPISLLNFAAPGIGGAQSSVPTPYPAVDMNPGATGDPADEHPPESEEPGAMANWLNEPGKAHNRLLRLGVEPVVVQWFAGAGQSSAVDAHWGQLRGSTGRPAAILFLPCVVAPSALLYAFEKVDGEWRITDRAVYDCFSSEVEFSLASIHGKNLDEVVIHHACSGHGSDYLEQQFLVTRLVGGKFKVELATEELRRITLVGTNAQPIERSSTFTVIPVAESSARAIEQTRSTMQDGRLRVERRVFVWNAAKGRYTPSGFASVFQPK